MIVAAHQPHYLPWIRFVDKLVRSDVFLLLDDVQFTKNGYQNRVRIKHAQGSMLLTVPVLDPFEQAICDVRINTQTRWPAKHRTAIATNYGKAAHFTEVRDALLSIYDRPWESLMECAAYALDVIVGLLGVGTRIVRSSTLGIPGRGTERLIELCRALGATTYLTGDFAVGHHFDPEAFAPHGIEVRRQRWVCPTYPQLYPQAGFIPELSIVDLLANMGAGALNILMDRPLAEPPLEAAEGSPGVLEAAGRPAEAVRPDEIEDSSVCRTVVPTGGSYTERDAAGRLG